MAYHLSRDYLTQINNTANHSYAQSYLLAIFLRRVLLYTHVGSTSFDINGAGSSLLIATGDTTPTAATPTFAVGTKAGINFGAGFYYEVSIPSGVRVVSGADVGRLLVLRSTANPTFNSGIFLITGFNTAGGVNRYILNWRSTDLPPAEAADSMNWYLYEADASTPTVGAANSGTGYRGNGTSTTPRIILQSPHATAWQVRICNETVTDRTTNATVPVWTAVPGFGGNSAGDFAVGGQHLHTTQFYDTASSAYRNTIGAGSIGASSETRRVTIGGDDTGQAVVVCIRIVTSTAGSIGSYVIFGLPDNEPTPLPNNVNRLFALGNTYCGSNSNFLNAFGFLTGIDTSINSEGTAFGLTGVPITAIGGSWVYLSGNAEGASPVLDASAGDSPFVGATELLPIDVQVGTFASWSSATVYTFPFEPRSIGTVPFVRHGRSLGNYTATTDAGHAWYHFLSGFQLQYGGPLPLA
jgi:hypothetical protein